MGVKVVKYIRLLMFFLLSGHLQVEAQNNPYKIDDTLFSIYETATRNRHNPEGLLIADTLYAKSVQKQDKKAECLALTIPVVYYFNHNQLKELEHAIEKLKSLSRKNNYLQYYYFASIYHVNFFLNKGYSLRALQEAEAMKEQAFKDNYPYGISTCMRMLGNIYVSRGNRRQALKHFQEALAYTQQYLPEQDQAMLYWNISKCYLFLEQLELAYENLDKGIKVAKTNENKVSCILAKTVLLYHMGRYEEFESSYQENMQLVKRYGEVKKNTVLEMKIYHHIINQRYEQAHSLADSCHHQADSWDYHRQIYLKEGKYKEAYEMYRQRRQHRDSINQELLSADLAELNVRVGNERLKQEAQALQLENTRLNLQNTTLELKQAKAQIEMEKMNAENNKLQLDNRNLELAQLKIKAEKQQHQMKEQQLMAQNELSILRMRQVLLLFLVLGLVAYLYMRHRSISALHKKNKELVVAREQAEQADRMKTLFLQNMSHEIRTPLNAIVGFSQILTDTTLEVSDEEKGNFSHHIQQNSELLTTLINDILDLSSLESGKYTMNLQPCNCNELCRTALDTVAHRKPERVNLYFTSEVANDFQLTTDGKRLQQVLINFLTNAEKNTEEGEIRLHCSLSEHPGKVTFSVSDTGPGIPADKADSIFERFKKLNEFKQGTGLGLNICRIIAERLHGEVALDKSYTHGARFVFILPLQEA